MQIDRPFYLTLILDFGIMVLFKTKVQYSKAPQGSRKVRVEEAKGIRTRFLRTTKGGTEGFPKGRGKVY